MVVSAIVALGNNRVIGKDNDLPWYLPADLKHFKKTTLDHHIIMGRKCFESIGKPLPKRTNIILTRNPFYVVSNCIVCSGLEEALEIAFDNKESEAFIIGGGEIYKAAFPLLDRLYLTQVDVTVEDNGSLIYFPEVDLSEWKLVIEEKHKPDEKNKYNYSFQEYERITIE